MKYNTVAAPSPKFRDSRIELTAHPETLRQFEDGRLNAKIGEFLGLVHGKDGQGLISAHALFQGLHRPLNNQARDAQTYVYVLSPTCSYTFEDKHGDPKPTTAPRGSVFMVFAEIPPGAASGTILFWEWALADNQNNKLPYDSNNRFKKKIW